MTRLIHIIVLLSGIVAYVFTDVDSPSLFRSTGLPMFSLLSFLYFLGWVFVSLHRSPSSEQSAERLLAGLNTAEQVHAPVEKHTGSVRLEQSGQAGKSDRVSVSTIVPETVITPNENYRAEFSQAQTRRGHDHQETLGQGELNQQEWENPDNWSGPKLVSMYFSKLDSRVLVPRQIPQLGFTFNFGQDRGVVYGLLVRAALLVIVVNIIIITLNK